MKNLLSKKAFVAFAAGAMLLSSCHDNDIYDPSDIVKDYADNWQKTFGDIDPNQDWNVATSVTASAALDIPGSSTMKIYTANPLSSESRLLAVTNLSNGIGSISFDAIKGSSSLFVAIYQDNKYIIFDNYPVENGKININTTSGAAKVATRAITRAADMWTKNHNDDWMSYLNFSLPENYITVNSSDVTLSSGNTYYVPNNFNGTLNFDNFNGDLYVAAKITQFSGNPGNVNLYILESGSWECAFTTGTITAYNQGSIILPSWGWRNQNLKTVYNGGYIKIGTAGEKPDFADGVSLYSNGTGIVDIVGNETDLKLACDIHGTMNVNGDLKIQNGKTQYICGLEVSGHLEMTQGKLESSYVSANDIMFDGAEIWLLPEGHIVAKEKISMVNSATYIHGHTNSNGLVESKDFYFRNKNNFTNSFSSNIYFKIGGSIDIEEILVRDNGQQDNVYSTYNNAAEYMASQNGKELVGRLNVELSGNPECGDTWKSDGTTPTTPTPDEVEKNEKPMSWIIACEDLGSKDDIDFNDVVVSVSHVVGETKATVTPLAAGGIYNANIGFIDKGSFGEIHKLFGQEGNDGSQLMINTGADIDGLTATPIEIEVSKDYKLSYSAANETNMGGFYIKVTHTGDAKTIIGATIGEAPQMILVPGDWKWPKERINIKDAYNLFETWSGKGTEYKWYETISNPSYVYGGSDDNGNSGEGGYGVSLAQYIASETTIPSSVFEPYKETGAIITVTVGTDPSWLAIQCIVTNPNGGWYFADWNIPAGTVKTFKLTKEDISDIINDNGLKVSFGSNATLEGVSGFYIKAAN